MGSSPSSAADLSPRPSAQQPIEGPRQLAAAFVKLPGTDRATIIVAACALPLIRLALRITDFKRLKGLVSRIPVRANPIAPASYVDHASHRAQTIDLAGRRVPGGRHCLTKSTLLMAWLQRYGVPASLRVAVDPRLDEFGAHAWVEVSDRVVNDHPGKVVEMPTFPEALWEIVPKSHPLS